MGVAFIGAHFVHAINSFLTFLRYSKSIGMYCTAGSLRAVILLALDAVFITIIIQTRLLILQKKGGSFMASFGCYLKSQVHFLWPGYVYTFCTSAIKDIKFAIWILSESTKRVSYLNEGQVYCIIKFTFLCNLTKNLRLLLTIWIALGFDICLHRLESK